MKYLSMIFMMFTLSACASDYFYEYGKKVELTPIDKLSTRSVDLQGVRYYKTKDGKEVGIKNEIIVKLKKDVDSKEFFSKYNIKNTEHLGSTTYLLKLEKSQNVFTLSQKMYKDSSTIYAIPNRIKKYQKR